jgi:hypothetical protein
MHPYRRRPLGLIGLPDREIRADLPFLHDIAGGVHPAFRGRQLGLVYDDLRLC